MPGGPKIIYGGGGGGGRRDGDAGIVRISGTLKSNGI